MKSTALITGSCGFLGYHMSSFLLKKGYKVIGIDNFLTGQKSNAEILKKNKNFNLIEQDVCSKIELNIKLDFIIHFASPASPNDYLRYPIQTLRAGSIGTENILKLGLKNKSKVLVASTSEIYGDPFEHPQKETYFGNVNTVGPRGVYDEAKRYLEALTMAYHKDKGLDTKIARIFNTYGPYMKKNDGRVIPSFINQMINSDEITIYGNGQQTRSFCYVTDTIKGIYKLIKSNYNYPVNIGNPDEYSILELLEIIKKLISNNSQIKFLKLPENDPLRRKPDIELAKKILKWYPKTTLKQGLEETIHYFYKH